MRNPIRILALGAAVAAAPAMAQVNVGLGGNGGIGVGGGAVGGSLGGTVGVGGNVGGNPGTAIGGVTGALDRTVDRVDGIANRTVDRLDRDLELATSADLTAGAVVRDGDGRKIGTVQSLHGDMAVIVKGDRELHVPLSSLYRGARGLVVGLTDRELRAAIAASAQANAGAEVRR